MSGHIFFGTPFSTPNFKWFWQIVPEISSWETVELNRHAQLTNRHYCLERCLLHLINSNQIVQSNQFKYLSNNSSWYMSVIFHREISFVIFQRPFKYFLLYRIAPGGNGEVFSILAPAPSLFRSSAPSLCLSHLLAPSLNPSICPVPWAHLVTLEWLEELVL